MDLILDALTPADVEAVRGWRNRDDVRAGLRTPHLLTAQQQRAWYDAVVCDRRSPHRYWAVRERSDAGGLVAVVGLTDIAWENGTAEISLITDPDRTGVGIGTAAVRLVLTEAFDRMRLLAVHGECYEHNPAWAFWRRLLGDETRLWPYVPYRKYWDGESHGAWFFWFTPDGRWRTPDVSAHTPDDAVTHG